MPIVMLTAHTDTFLTAHRGNLVDSGFLPFLSVHDLNMEQLGNMFVEKSPNQGYCHSHNQVVI